MEFRLGCVLAIAVWLPATTATANTFVFSTTSPDVMYAVSDGGFFVSSAGITKTYASASIAGSSFQLVASGSGYSDAGIVLYFNGGLKLGDLASVVVATDNPSAIAINLWLDTGGDGQFFAFDNTGLLTALNGDNYGTHAGSTLTNADAPANNIQMFQGGGTGTLAYFQSGAAAAFGITSSTPTALWIGLTNPNTANISSITVDQAGHAPEPSSVLLLGGGLAAVGTIRRRSRNSRARGR